MKIQVEKSPEEKEYLLCIVDNSGGEWWYIASGRSDAVNYIQDQLSAIDIDESFILVESVCLENRQTLRAFLNYVDVLENQSSALDNGQNITLNEFQSAVESELLRSTTKGMIE